MIYIESEVPHDSSPSYEIEDGDFSWIEVKRIDFILLKDEDYSSDICEQGIPYGDENEDVLRRLTFTSDLMFYLGMSNIETGMAEFLARKIIGDDSIVIKKVEVQKNLRIGKHHVTLDALATDDKGRLINFEMQSTNEPDMNKRLNFYGSSVILSALAKGAPYSAIPDFSQVVFMPNDRYKRGKAVYVSRMVELDGFVTDDSFFRYEVNMSYRGEDRIGSIIRDLDTREAKRMYNKVLRETMAYYKDDEEGRMKTMGELEKISEGWILRGFERGMKKSMEDGLQKGMEKGMQQGIEKGIDEGRKEERRANVLTLLKDRLLTPSQIAKSFDMPLSDVLEIAESIEC